MVTSAILNNGLTGASLKPFFITERKAVMRKLISACLWVLFLATLVPALAQQGKSPTIAVAVNGNAVKKALELK